MSNVYAVFECLAYEGEYLVGIFTTEEDARNRASLIEESDSLWPEVRKVELNKLYDDFTNVGEEI